MLSRVCADNKSSMLPSIRDSFWAESSQSIQVLGFSVCRVGANQLGVDMLPTTTESAQ